MPSTHPCHAAGLCASLVLAVAATTLAPAAAQAQTSVPPAIALPPKGGQAAKAAVLLLPASAPALAITLPAAAPAERAALVAKSSAASSKSKPGVKRQAVGFGRAVPASQGVRALSDLQWTTLDDGGRAAQIRVTSPGASALRVQVALAHAPAGLSLRFASPSSGQTFGPYPGSVASQRPYWSPVLEGDTATIEISLPPGTAVGDATVSLPMISHLVVAPAAFKQADPLRAIGTAGACEVDVACMSATIQQQAAKAINAVVRVALTDGGTTILCSATLVNDSIASGTPYLYFASHCIDNGDADPGASKGGPAAAAASINTYWFFQAMQCGVDTSSDVNFVMLPGGAKLLGRSVDYDWNLLKLNDAPPAGATFAAWNAAGPLANGLAASGIHHPEGDLKKFSVGSAQGYDTYNDGSSFIAMQWTQGVTEPGSSGSGLFTYNAASNYYELRGALYGGDSSCSAGHRNSIDDYSRLDVALPLIAQYLTPTAANPAKKVVVVEYYDATLDDYFITANGAEIRDLDNGVHPGWVRTGLTFLAYSDPAVAPAGAQPVCRFYVLPLVGDSHFYSADPSECAATAAKFAGTWVEESAALFYIEVPNPATGACPSGTRAVFRFVNAVNGLHHRYTAEVDVRDSIIDDGGWTQEGYGAPPAASVMCSPTS